MKELQPLNQNVLLELSSEKEKKTAGGIIIPDSVSTEKPNMAKVVALGNIDKAEISVGDTVLYAKFSGNEIDFEGKKYLIIPYANLLAKVIETEEI